MSLSAALSGKGLILPGDTVYLRAGTYAGSFNCTLNGTENHMITFTNFPGELVVIDGDLTLSGNYLRWIGT